MFPDFSESHFTHFWNNAWDPSISKLLWGMNETSICTQRLVFCLEWSRISNSHLFPWFSHPSNFWFYKPWVDADHETVGNLFITKFLKLSGWIHAIPFACNILAFLLHLSQNSTEFDCESHWRRYHTELMSFSWVLSECFLSPSVRQLDYSPAAVSPMTEAPHSRPGTRSLTVTPMPSWGVQKCLTHCFVYAINNYLVPLVTTLLDLKPL